jgi:SAM-dependent methyltransferase
VVARLPCLRREDLSDGEPGAIVSPHADYDALASIYDACWGGETLRALPVLDRLILGELRPGARVLDLCCGTGQLARALVERGFDVTGVDASAEMLRHARRHAPGARFLHADARAFATPGAHDAALSTFDSLNHIMSLVELGAVFRNVRRALVAGAAFLFDLNMEAGYEARWRGSSFGIARDDHAVIGHARWDGAARQASLTLTLFHGAGADWRRADVTLAQRCYEEADVRTCLAQAGFGSVLTYSGEAGASNVGRTYFLGRAS